MTALPNWLQRPLPSPDPEAEAAARAHQARLTKPAGALGRLETLAIHLAALQATPSPRVDPAYIAVFAADHGIAARGVSAYPQEVTAQMVANFATGGAAVSVLAALQGALLDIVHLGTVVPPPTLAGIRTTPIAAATQDMLEGPAMTAGQLESALSAGRDAADRAAAAGARLFIGGEMGIGNTTAATAMACALLDAETSVLVGPGTGLDAGGMARKADTIRRALARHREAVKAPGGALRCLGGFEIAALAGAFVRAAQQRLPVLVDGFIASVAALQAAVMVPALRPWLLYAHRSAEPGHAAVLSALAAEPLLDLGMRLGEGSGAAVALPLLRAACATHNGMATFAAAGVSDRAD